MVLVLWCAKIINGAGEFLALSVIFKFDDISKNLIILNLNVYLIKHVTS